MATCRTRSRAAHARGTVGAKGANGARLTATGAIIGTLPYMAPELLNGGGRAAAAPADIFAFGLIMHELLTGRPAFEAPPVFLAVHGLKPPTLPDGIARMVVALFDRCLLVDPSQRPTAQAVVDALHAART